MLTGRSVEVVPSWLRWFGRVVAVAVPWVVAVLYVLTAREFRHDDNTAAQIAALVLAIAQGVALVWRRQRPELVTAAVVIVGVPYQLIVPEIGIPFAGLVALWSLTLTRSPVCRSSGWPVCSRSPR